MTEHSEALSALWRDFAERECGTYSPLYAGICRFVATDDDLLALVLEAPPAAHLPNVLLAAVHYLLLEGLDHPLGDVYAGRATIDGAGELFKDVCVRHRQSVLELMDSRRTQTNECGRSALLVLGLAEAANELGEPVGLVDAGSSAGLNLLMDEYRIDYGEYGAIGPVDSPVRIDCSVRSPGLPVPEHLPRIGARIGLDRSPVDVDDPDDARWLLACVWPDTGRLGRTEAAIGLARQRGVVVRRGDMVADLAAVVAQVGGAVGGAVTVITSWSFAYLSPIDRNAFCEMLVDQGRRRPIAWLSAEGPGVVPMLEAPPADPEDDTTASVLGLAVCRDGHCDARVLARVHPHGSWIDWQASRVST